MNCNEAMAALVASLENATPMTEVQREHVRTCERCRGVLDSAKDLLASPGDPLPPAPTIDGAVAAAEEEVHRKRVRRGIAVVAGVAAVMAVAVILMLVPSAGDPLGYWLYAIGMAALISAGFAVPVLFIIYLMRGSARHRFYKRLKPGRMISGVCLGIAERTNVDVVVIRLMFLALLILAGGLGFWFYVALDVAMPVHPDDRQHLLRFRLRRWWQRRMAHATGG